MLLPACGISFPPWDVNSSGSLSNYISAVFCFSAWSWVSDPTSGNTEHFKFLLKRTCTVRVLTPTQVRYSFDSTTKEGSCELQFPQSCSVFISKGERHLSEVTSIHPPRQTKLNANFTAMKIQNFHFMLGRRGRLCMTWSNFRDFLNW